MEQMVARRAHNPKVLGSSPSPATKLRVFCLTTKDFFHFIKNKPKIIFIFEFCN